MTTLRSISRREAIKMGLGFAGSALLAGCLEHPTIPDHVDELRITARPGNRTGSFNPGQQSLQVGAREALLYVPPNYVPATAAPLALLLHGAGSTPQDLIDTFQPRAATQGLCMLACKSLGFTWDAMSDRFTDDIPLFDDALAIAFANLNIDTSRIAVEGFSDGATFAIALGRANGDFFTRVSAQSMGALIHTTGVQKPKFYITHGSQDEVLPATQARSISSNLSQVYQVTYEEYNAGHVITSAIATKVVDFMALP